MKTLVAVCVCLLAILAVSAKEPAKETTTAAPTTTTSPSPSTTESTTPASDSKKPKKEDAVSAKSPSGDAAKGPSKTEEEESSGNATVTDKPGFKSQVRNLPADVLRDFPGLCFASTLCRVFQVGEQWPLFPFCGVSTCVETPEGGLIEVVEDCGPLPDPESNCRIINEPSPNSTFPECCPIFECGEGVKPQELPVPSGEGETKAEASDTSSA